MGRSKKQTPAANLDPAAPPAGIVGGSISRLISVLVLVIVIVAIGILFYRVMVGFFVPLFLAALLVVIFRPMHRWFCDRSGKRPQLAALMTTAMILLIVLMPAGIVLSVAAAQGTRLLSVVNSQTLTLAIGRARGTFGLSMEAPELHQQLTVAINRLADRPRQGDTGQADTQAQIQEVREITAKLRQVHQNSPQLDSGLFVILDEQLDALQVQARELENAATASDWQQWQDYQQSLVAVDETLTQLQNQLLGGAVRAELKRLANPSDADIHDVLVRGRMYLQSKLPSVASATTEFVFQLVFGSVVLIIAIYFFLLDGPAMTRTLMRLSPLDDSYEEQLLMEFDRTSRAVVLATILSALTQGVLAGFGYYLAGMDSVVLLFLATTFMALIPFLGALSVWLPCVLWLGFVDQRWGAAIALALWGALVVSTIDNVIKVFILHGRSQLHPLLALLSVLGGVQVFGPIGLLVGPMVVVFLQTLLEILHHELLKDRDPKPEPTS